MFVLSFDIIGLTIKSLSEEIEEKQVTFIGARFTSPSTVEGGSIFGMILLT